MFPTVRCILQISPPMSDTIHPQNLARNLSLGQFVKALEQHGLGDPASIALARQILDRGVMPSNPTVAELVRAVRGAK